MKSFRNKTTATLIAFLLIVTLTTSMSSMFTANAHSPQWSIPTWVYVVPAPLQCQLGSPMTFVMWLTLLPPSSSVNNDWNWRGIKLTLTKPSGATEVLGGAAGFTTDSTGSTYTSYVPDEIGNWTVTVNFPGQVYGVNPPFTIGNIQGNAFYNDTFQASSFTTTFSVQQESLQNEFVTWPLPTEYWTRPIEGQNTEWYRIASNWLSSTWQGGTGGAGTARNFQPDGIGPNSGHIMWTLPIEAGGVVGGSRSGAGLVGNQFYDGSFYNLRFVDKIIMNGKLYFSLPNGNSGTGGGFECVDLTTGEIIWRKDATTYPTTDQIGTGLTNQSAPTFGYLYAYEHYNQHGVIPPGWLFQNNFARAIDPLTGAFKFNITDVPSGSEAIGPAGEWLRYVIRNSGDTNNPSWRLIQWNSSDVFDAQNSGSLNASIYNTNNIDWNVTINYKGLSSTFPSSNSIQAVEYGDLILGRNGSLSATTSYSPYVTYWAISLKPETLGNVLWMKNIPAPPNNMTLISRSAAEGVFIMEYKETNQWLGYDMHTGDLLWGPTKSELDYNPYGYFSTTVTVTTVQSLAYGKFFSFGYSGMCFAYDLHNGTLLWRYEDPTNKSVWNYYPKHLLAIADHKLYFGTQEHSSSKPLFKGNEIVCLDTETGKEVWRLPGWGSLHSGGEADGFLVYQNNYDNQIYCIGKGPSATTIAATPSVSVNGNGVLISGTITDQSPGSKAKGTAAMSDESMGDWMAHKFMQKPIPANAKGVTVSLDTVDPNGNYVHIGNATSDTNGLFSLAWTPEIPGKYTVFATFAGSESYWPSNADTAIYVQEAPQATAAPTAQPQSVSDTYFVPAIAGLFVLNIIVAVVIVLMLRKRQ